MIIFHFDDLYNSTVLMMPAFSPSQRSLLIDLSNIIYFHYLDSNRNQMNDYSSGSSLEGSPFKPKEQEPPTRHPTTVKKQLQSSSPPRSHARHSQASEGRRAVRSQSLRGSILTLKEQKQRCLHSGRYSEAGWIESRIRRTKSMLQRGEAARLDKAHKSQEKSIRAAHEQEVALFEQAWASYFARLKDYQRGKLQQFQEQQDQEIEFIREKLRKKSNRLHKPSRHLVDLEREEQHHLGCGNIAELVLVRREKKRLVGSLRLERKEVVSRWTYLEGKQLERLQQKRYCTLVGRMQEQQNDEKALLLRQRRRLSKKYRNILGQLRHEQQMTLNFVRQRQKTL